ncbi:Precorrin-8X methylmutase [Halomonadaceae bacterium LMG 33818]|uniref:precorrin-8X methylmutase n=1 Tax=Cernens ardua TaxID=3402176 RepID=UPI003EDC0DF5
MSTSFEYQRDGQAIYRQSFSIIRSETDLSRFDTLESDIAVRMIHACGVVELANAIEFGYGFAKTARNAIVQGKPIFCDAEMVDRGITRKRLPAHNPVICTLRHERTAAFAEELGTTRSAAAISLWGEAMEGALVVVGNAPTALFHLLEVVASGGPRPAAVIGVPVGFVGAAESKQALAESPLKLPYVIVKGRMGGSAIASAAVNALASDAL